LKELAATVIANAGDFGWTSVHVEDRFASRTGASAAETGDDLVDGKIITHDRIKLDFVPLEKRL
jgi:hypothetical protein